MGENYDPVRLVSDAPGIILECGLREMVAIKFLIDNGGTTAVSSLRRVTLAPPYTIAALLQKTIPGASASEYIVQVALTRRNSTDTCCIF